MPDKPKIVPLFGRAKPIEDIPEVSFAPVPVASRERTSSRATASNVVDLSKSPKVVFLIGPGGTGKTTLARWLGWRSAEGDRPMMMAALDPQNRSLASWMEDVQMPPSTDAAQTARWLQDLLGYMMDTKTGGVLDFGDGDTALARFIEATPDCTEVMRAAGIEPVALSHWPPDRTTWSCSKALSEPNSSHAQRPWCSTKAGSTA